MRTLPPSPSPQVTHDISGLTCADFLRAPSLQAHLAPSVCVVPAPLPHPSPCPPSQVTHDISGLTCADFLRAPGVQTPVIVRFSTVVHERGSPETLRDPRGFAVKFYTREGNFDMVGNNMPVRPQLEVWEVWGGAEQAPAFPCSIAGGA